MIFRKLLPFVFCLMLLASCQPANKEVKTYPITLEKLPGGDFLMSGVSQLVLFDSVLAVRETRRDSVVHLYDLRENRYIGMQCPIGQGPDEFTPVLFLSADRRGGCTAYDPNLSMLYRLKREAKGTIGLQRIWETDKTKGLLHSNIYPLGNGTYLATGIYDNHCFCLLDSTGNTIRAFGEYPYRDKEERQLSGIIKSQIYQGNITIAPSGKKFLASKDCGDLISIYAIETDSFRLLKNVYATFPEYKYQEEHYLGMSRETPLTYLDAVSTDDLVFLLYSGRSVQEAALSAFYGNRIFVLNWEGEKVTELQCEQDLAALCLSPDGKTMYVIAYNPEPEVMYFRLPLK